MKVFEEVVSLGSIENAKNILNGQKAYRDDKYVKVGAGVARD